MAIPFSTVASDNSILEIIREASGGIKQARPTTLDSTSKDVTSWVFAANEAGKKIRDAFIWPALRRRFTFEGVDNQLIYSLPLDFNRLLFDTYWNESTYRPMLGPLTSREWEARKNSSAISSVLPQWQMLNGNEVEFMSELSTDDVIVFPFYSLNWIRPALTWAASTAVTAGEYCYYSGRVYKATTTGTTGATAPTHWTGSVSDGGVTWLYSVYEKVIENGAIPLVDREALLIGTQRYWLSANGYDYEDKEIEFRARVKKQKGGLHGAQSFNLACSSSHKFMGAEVFPESITEY